MDKVMDGGSLDNVKELINKIKELVPEAVSEGRLDYDLLMALLGDDFDNDNEKYQFTWKGKLEALRLAQKRSTATLRPAKGEGVDWDTTKNLYIEGDNLEALKLLQQGYLRKVKMIYIDPPYNTGNPSYTRMISKTLLRNTVRFPARPCAPTLKRLDAITLTG